MCGRFGKLVLSGFCSALYRADWDKKKTMAKGAGSTDRQHRLGFSALLVSERLGHENVSTTLDIYSHLFPSKQSEVAERLELICAENDY